MTDSVLVPRLVRGACAQTAELKAVWHQRVAHIARLMREGRRLYRLTAATHFAERRSYGQWGTA